MHRVRKRNAGGLAEYWYAWRGGPCILKATAATPAQLARAVGRAVPDAVRLYDENRTPNDGGQFLYGLITRYLAAMAEDDKLAERTKRDRRKFLDKARTEIGHMELKALESRRARSVLVAWRDQYSKTPKTADELLGAVSTVLQWAEDRGDVLRNPVKDFPRLYKVNRADIIWEPHHMAALLAQADPDFALAVRLAALTGLREGDLIALPWGAVGDDAIVWQTGKSRGRKTVVIPMTPKLKALLAEIPKRATTVLASSRKTPWKQSGLAAGLRRARIAALEHAQKVHGPDAKSGIEGLRFHDLRGTAATNFLLAGLTFEDVALVLGWKLERVKEIAARYISGQAMGQAMVLRLQRNASATKAVNRAVNRASDGPPKGAKS